MKGKTIILHASAATALALMSSQVNAQAVDSASGTAAAQPSTPGGGIQDIVVTAQKQAVNLQRTPAAITAIDSKTMVTTGITDLRAAQIAIPGARFQQEGNSTQVFLRGVGSNLDFANIEQSVSFNFNGIYVPREATSVPLYDMERIEALPGPQGTLYGRSAIGGIVNASFARPEMKQGASIVLEGGNYDLAHITAVVNEPLSSDLAIRAAADYTYHSGYMESGADSKKDFGGRLSLLYRPSTDLSIYIWGYTTQKNGSPANLVNKGFDPATGGYSENAFLRDRPWDDLRPGTLAAFAPFGQPTPPTQIYHNYAGGAQVDWKLSDTITLTYIPGYMYLNTLTTDYWLGGIPSQQGAKYRQLSQELRLAGKSGKIDWLFGAYGYRTVNSGHAIILYGTPSAFYASHVLRNRLEGLAAYGQATYHATDRLRVTLGGRIGVDDRTGRGIAVDDQVTPYSYSKSFVHPDYKAAVEYDLAPKVMAYLAYQTGYQPGTYNEVANTATTSNAIKKATLNAISGGIKSRFLDNRLQINVEGFYYTYKNLFIQAFDASKFYNPIFNAQKVTIPGFQLDAIVKPTSNDELSASVSYAHARNKKFITPAGDNFDGLQPPYAADWTISGNAFHDFQLGGGYIRIQADARYESAYFADYVHNLGTRQKPYVKGDATLTYFDNHGWSLGAWIKNIGNVPVIAATAAAGIPGPATAYLEAPRTFGGRLTFNY